MTDSGKLGTSPGRSIDSKGIGNTDILVEVVEFTPEVILRDPRTADIITQNNRDIMFQSCLCTGNDSLEYNIAIVLLYLCRIGDRTVK